MSNEDRGTNEIYRSAPGGTVESDTTAGPGPALMSAGTLIGNDVYNADGDDLGDIKEIMLDMRNGRVAYAVLSSGGMLSMGEKLFAIPWNALTLDTMNKRFILNIHPDRLQDAPGFDREAWPDMANAAWGETVHAWYGTKPYQDELRP